MEDYSTKSKDELITIIHRLLKINDNYENNSVDLDRFNELVADYNELREENKTMEATLSLIRFECDKIIF